MLSCNLSCHVSEINQLRYLPVAMCFWDDVMEVSDVRFSRFTRSPTSRFRQRNALLVGVRPNIKMTVTFDHLDSRCGTHDFSGTSGYVLDTSWTIPWISMGGSFQSLRWNKHRDWGNKKNEENTPSSHVKLVIGNCACYNFRLRFFP